MIKWNRYIAANQPEEVNSILRSYGYPEVDNENDTAEAIAFIVDEKGEQGFNKVFAIHPDYDTIIEHYQENYVEPLIEERPKAQSIQSTPNVNSSVSNDTFFSNSVKELLTIVMLFWLINKIISK